MRVFIAAQQQSDTSLQDTVPQTNLSGTLTCPWLPPLPVCNNRRLSANRINTAGAERGRGEALAQAQLSVSSQCGLTGVRFTRAWTGGTVSDLCPKECWPCNNKHFDVCVRTCFYPSVALATFPFHPWLQTGWFMSVDEELFLRTDYLCVCVWVCVFP